MPGQSYDQITVTGTSPTYTGSSFSMYRTLDATGPRRYGEPWFRCCQCGLDFPRSQVVMFRGKAWGIPCTDYKDIQQLARRKR